MHEGVPKYTIMAKVMLINHKYSNWVIVKQHDQNKSNYVSDDLERWTL